MRNGGLVVGLALAAAAVACTSGGGEETGAPSPGASRPAALLPDEFPLPPSATGLSTVATAAGGIIVQFELDLPRSRAQAFFDTELRKNGWRVLGVAPTELLTKIDFGGNGWGGSVTVVEGTTTKVVVTMSPEPTTGG